MYDSYGELYSSGEKTVCVARVEVACGHYLPFVSDRYRVLSDRYEAIHR